MDLNELLYEAYGMPESETRATALKEGIRLADQAGDNYYSVAFRVELITDASVSGIYVDVRDAVVAFSWLLGHIDKYGFDTEWEYDVHDMLDHYQWICSKIAVYPEISLEQVHSLMEDFRERLTDAGYTLRPYHEAQIHTALLIEDIQMAEVGYKGFFGGKKDSIVRCDACIDGVYVKYHTIKGDYEGAMKAAKPLLDQKHACNANPRAAFHNMIMMAVKNDIYDDTIADIRDRGYKLVAKDAFFMDTIGWHMLYYSKIDLQKGLNLYKKHLPWSFSTHRSPLCHYAFHMGAAVLMKKLSATRKTFKAHISDKFPLFKDDYTYEFTKLGEYHYGKAAELALLYDKRNGKTGYTNYLTKFYAE